MTISFTEISTINLLSDRDKETLLVQVLLAQAAYAKYDGGIFDSDGKLSVSRGNAAILLSTALSPGEINYILSKTSVVGATGFLEGDGLIFAKRNDSNEIFISGAGTDPVQAHDLYADVKIGVSYSNASRIDSEVKKILDYLKSVDPGKSAKLHISGHSLYGEIGRGVADRLIALGYNVDVPLFVNGAGTANHSSELHVRYFYLKDGAELTSATAMLAAALYTSGDFTGIDDTQNPSPYSISLDTHNAARFSRAFLNQLTFSENYSAELNSLISSESIVGLAPGENSQVLANYTAQQELKSIESEIFGVLVNPRHFLTILQQDELDRTGVVQFSHHDRYDGRDVDVFFRKNSAGVIYAQLSLGTASDANNNLLGKNEFDYYFTDGIVYGERRSYRRSAAGLEYILTSQEQWKTSSTGSMSFSGSSKAIIRDGALERASSIADENDIVVSAKPKSYAVQSASEDGLSQVSIRSADRNGILAVPEHFVEQDGSAGVRVRAAAGDENLAGQSQIFADLLFKPVYRYDSSGRAVLDDFGNPVVDGTRSGSIVTYTSGPKKGITTIQSSESPLGIEFDKAGGLLGNILGKSIAGDSELGQALGSAFFKTLGQTLGDLVDSGFDGGPTNFSGVIDGFDDRLLLNLKLKAVGLVSGYLAGQLIGAIGVDGFVGDVASTAVSEALRSQVGNLLGVGVNNVGLNVANAVGALIGTKLAGEVISFGSVGGQLGAQIGSAALPILATALVGGPISLPLVALGAAAAFVGYILGGAIGSIFGGTPRSGADVAWDGANEQFTVTNVVSKNGGSKEAARSLATSVATFLNGVIAASGGSLDNPEAVQSGNYGMRKKDFVYRPETNNTNAGITQTFSGKTAAAQLIGFGIHQAVSDPDFKIVGGDVYVKRAIYNSFSIGTVDALNFDPTILSGNIATAQRYERYLENAEMINALVSAQPDSVFAAETIINLARAEELGIARRAASDWFGGFSLILDEADKLASETRFGLDYDLSTGNIARNIFVGQKLIGDTIDIGRGTNIEGGNGSDIIDLRSGTLADRRGLIVNGKNSSDIAIAGADFFATQDTLAFAPGEIRKALAVDLMVDGIDEDGEYFLASLADSEGMTIMGGAATVTVLDGAAPILMVGRSYASELDGFAQFRVSLSKAASTAVTVALTLDSGSATGAGIDYGSIGSSNLQVWNGGTWADADTATFSPGITEIIVRTPISSDNIASSGPGGALNIEGNETFTLTAKAVIGASSLANGGAAVSGLGTIVDSSIDAAFVWIDNVVANESSGQAIAVVSRSRSTPATASVNISTSDRRAVSVDVAANIDGGAGNDVIFASDRGDNVFGGAGDDALFGGRLDDWLFGGAGNDSLDAGSPDPAALGGDGNYLNGGAGNDTLRGREGSDWLEGGDGTDQLYGGAGDDILAGGAGNGDGLRGGEGGDQYIVRRGDGADDLEEEVAGAFGVTGDAIAARMAAIAAGTVRADWIGTSAGVVQGRVQGGEDSLVFGEGIEIGDIRLQRSGTAGAPGNDLIVIVMETVNGVEQDSGTRVTIRDWFSNPFKRVEWLKFLDGTELRIGDITSFIIGGAGNDVLIGTNGNDFVAGGAGDDQLFLLAGDDIGNGGTGNDFVAGDAGKDLVIGGLGNDQLLGGAGQDVVTGDAGSDLVYGGADNDIVSGGRGDGDEVVGGAGNDTFKYARGDGRDVIFDEFIASAWSTVFVGGVWSAGYTFNEATGVVTGPNGELLRKNVGTAENPDMQWVGRYDFDAATGTFRRFVTPAAGSMVTNSGIDTLELAPGINIQDVILRRVGNDLVLVIANDDAETLDASKVTDSITIKDWYTTDANGATLAGQIERFAFYQTGVLDVSAGARTLIAGTDGTNGNSTNPFAGTAIADWITGGAGDDYIAGGQGNDILAGNSGNDGLRGEAGDDVLYGGAGDDGLDGGSGKDILVGGSGIDTAVYSSGGASVRAYLSASFANLGDAIGDEYHSIENLSGGASNDTLGGDANNNLISGAGGNDTLLGGAGNDIYYWDNNYGSDTVYDLPFVVEEAVTTAGTLSAGYTTNWASTGIATSGGYYWRLQVYNSAGELVYDYDRFVKSGSAPALPTPASYVQSGWLGGFARGNGQQVTREKFNTGADGGVDTLEMGDGESLSNLIFVWSGNDLYIRHGGSTTQQVRIRDQALGFSRIETLQFYDGQSVSLANVLVANGAPLNGTNGDDLLAGSTAGDDHLSGGGGNDALTGYAGNDQLYGGDGDDVLEGGLGADVLDGGSNSDIISSPTSGDTVRYYNSGAAVTIDLTLSGPQADVGATSESSGDTLIGIENVLGSAYADTISGDAGANRLSGWNGDDTLRGRAGDDVLLGGTGNDNLYGDEGADALYGDDGNDKLWGGDGNDQLAGNAGDDIMYGDAGDDMLTGGAGVDQLYGGAGNDTLIGEAGNDILEGGDGDDILAGGTGVDTLKGGNGLDTYLFDAMGDADTITDGSGLSTIVFDSSVRYENLWFARSGNSLVISVIGGTTQVTLTNFYIAGGSKVRAVQTTTHAMFLDHPDTLNLVTAMTAASPTKPAAMPTTISDQLGYYWHSGGKAAPTAPSAPRTATINEDTPLVLSGAWGVVDHDGGPLTYSLLPSSAPLHGAITAIDATTGVLTYTPELNYYGEDHFSIVVTDADNQSVELKVAVNILPVNDAPGPISVIGGGALSIAEGAPGTSSYNMAIIGKFTAIDPEGDFITYSIVNDAGGRFSIDPDGTLRVVNTSLLDREAQASHQIVVQATDSYGAARLDPFTVEVANVNETPNVPVITTSRGSVSEATATPSTPSNISGSVAQFALSDPDGLPAPALRLTNNPYGLFKTVGSEVQFTLEPDFEALVAQGLVVTTSGDRGYVTVTGSVDALDAGNLNSASTSFSIQVWDSNEQHSASATNKAASITERDRVANGTARPEITLANIVVDHGGDNATQKTAQYNYAVYEGSSTTVSTRFSVINGRLVLLANQSVDYEAQSSISLVVRVTDTTSSPLSFDLPLTFSVVNQIDILEGGAGADTLTGQQNADIIRGFGNPDILYGGAGDDELYGGDSNDVLYGENGNDKVYGDNGDDYVDGGAGNDYLYGGAGSDRIWGRAGNDYLYGGSGNEGSRVSGTDWWRRFDGIGMWGHEGNDRLYGEDGDDYLDGGLGADIIDGGAGFDGVYYGDGNAINVNLATGVTSGGTDGDTLVSIEYVQGSGFSDTITGSATNEVLYGGGGNDTLNGAGGDDYLFGEAGNDTINGGDGNDYLDGGAGNDLLNGGNGNDTYFVARGQGDDKIQNFDPSGDDFDHLTFDGSILYTDIWFDRVDAAGNLSSTGSNVKLTILGASGTQGSVTIENWFTAPMGGQPDAYFKVDLISDGVSRATTPIDVEGLTALMAAVPAGSRPTTSAGLAALRASDSFRIAMEDYWRRLTAPNISDVTDIVTSEPLDGEIKDISFNVRAWYDDPANPSIVIPASNIDLELTSGTTNLSDYFTMSVGATDAAGNRTVTLRLKPNTSTAGLPGNILAMQMVARIRGTSRTAGDLNGFNLNIAPTADTASLSASSPGGQAGSLIPLYLNSSTPDADGSERVDLLIAGLPSGYSLVTAGGVTISAWEGNEVRVTAAQIPGLMLNVPNGSYLDANLVITPQSIDGSSTRRGIASNLLVAVNGVPTGVTLSGSVAENAGADTFVGTLVGVDPDSAETPQGLTYQLLNDAGGRYKLDPNNNSRLLVANGGGNTFDYEAANRDALHTITVRVRDADGAYVDRNIAVGVTNVNEVPLAPSGGANYWAFFDETGLGGNPANGHVTIRTFNQSDPDGPGGLSLYWDGGLGGWFYLDQAGSSLRFNPGVNFDFEYFRAMGYGVADYNADGRLDAHIANAWIGTNDGSLSGPGTLTQIFISNVNERPNNLVLEASNVFQETTGGATHSGLLQARFGSVGSFNQLTDPDGDTPQLVILGGNQNGWFHVNGNHIQITDGVNWTADWLRGNKGQWGVDPDFYYDVNGNGLKEIRVATLTVATQDAFGARSDPFTYQILIEDKNEAPSAGWQYFYPAENLGWYQHVGTMTGSDIDGPASDLRYAFTGGDTFWDGNLGRQVSRTPDQRFVMDLNGNIFTFGSQVMDFEGARDFGYNTIVVDRGWGANAIGTGSWLEIHLQNIDEPHWVSNIAVGVVERNAEPGLAYPVANIASIVHDPERDATGQQSNIIFRFANGAQTVDGWYIDPNNGNVFMMAPKDYDAYANVYDGYYDEWGNWNSYYVGRDPNRANFNYIVEAYNVATGQQAQSWMTINLIDDNEDPVLYTGPYSWDHISQQSQTEYWIIQNRGGSRIINLYPDDPEHRSFNYWIGELSYQEAIWQYGGNDKIDATDYPSVYMANDGYSTGIAFWTPGEGGGEWEGGVKKDGWRRTSTVTATFNLYMQDDVGKVTSVPFTIRFLRRGSSVPPIVIDLDGDGVELVDYNGSNVKFDMDSDGIRDTTGWIAADDGVLALDRNGNGTIDDVSEISFLDDEEGALSDLEGLRAFDTNSDNFLDANDTRFGEFRIWQDSNQDGISQAEELRTLTEAGIARLGLTIELTGTEPGTDNNIYSHGDVVWADGSITQSGDVFLAFDPSNYEKLAAPIILDLDEDGTTVVPLADSETLFDMAGDGQLHKTAWLDQGDAFLVRDRNGDGLINDISEISFIGDKAGAKTDLEGLAGFDENGDGVLDGEDGGFAGFGAWIDRNSNGVTDAGELLSLTQLGVVSINLRGTPTGQTIEARNQGESVTYNISSFTYEDGNIGSLSDVALAYDTRSAGTVTGGRNVELASLSFSRKAKHYVMTTMGGSLFVKSRDPKGTIDSSAGKIAPGTILNFRNMSVGMLAPIFLDLDGDGIEWQSKKKSKAWFDMDGDGIVDDTGWVGKGDGILVIDRDKDGLITKASELSFLNEVDDAETSFEGLMTLDANKDGKIDTLDKRFADLKVWVDQNRNGVSEAGELKALEELQITEISVRAKAASTSSAWAGSNMLLATSTFTRSDGSIASLGEAAMAFDPSSVKRQGSSLTDTSSAALAASEMAEDDPDMARILQMIQAMNGFAPQSSATTLAAASELYTARVELAVGTTF